MTNIDHTISTGNKYIDKGIAKVGGMLLNHIVKDPRAKLAVKGVEKVYPYVEIGAANIARAKTAYNEVCRKKK